MLISQCTEIADLDVFPLSSLSEAGLTNFTPSNLIIIKHPEHTISKLFEFQGQYGN